MTRTSMGIKRWHRRMGEVVWLRGVGEKDGTEEKFAEGRTETFVPHHFRLVGTRLSCQRKKGRSCLYWRWGQFSAKCFSNIDNKVKLEPELWKPRFYQCWPCYWKSFCRRRFRKNRFPWKSKPHLHTLSPSIQHTLAREITSLEIVKIRDRFRSHICLKIVNK